MALKAESQKRITKAIIESIKLQFQETSFDFDEGELKLVDVDESGVFFGLFEVDPETGEPEQRPVGYWFIEVSFSPPSLEAA